MIHQVIYYLVLYPISLLPLRFLYLFADLLFVLFIAVFPYRKTVIEQNLINSFPGLSDREIKQLRRRFYRHFADLLIEGIKNFSISKKALLKRYRVKNPEVMQALFDEGRSVLLVSGHYNNWEWLITSQNILFQHQAVGIGMPLSNGFWDKKLNERRARFGMKIIHSKIVNDFFKTNNNTIATLVLSDQSPGDSNKAYWMEFLNQPTAILFGAEMLAHTYNHAVVFFHVEKIKRGFYEMELSLIAKEPRKCQWGEITEVHTKKLEAVIKSKPEFWLWSHKRWKRELPKDLQHLQLKQKAQFEQRFKQ